MKLSQKSMGYAVLLSGCMKPVPATPTAVEAVENSWGFELTLGVETHWEDAGAEDVLSPETARLREAGHFEVSWKGRISEGPYRINRDETESWRLLFEEVVDSEGHEQPLQGRALETRRFPGGSLLSLQQAEWVASPVALGDGIDPLLGLMFLQPPVEGRNGLQFQDFSWPFRIGRGQKSQQTVPLSWTELEAKGGYQFEGPLGGRLQDREWGVRGEVDGLVRGELRLNEQGDVQEIRFRVEREIRFHELGGEGRLHQSHVLSGRLETTTDTVVSAWPREFYLTEADVLNTLVEARGAFEECAPQPDWTIGLDFEIGVDGSAFWRGDGPIGDCKSVVEALVFPPHHLPGLRIQTQLVLRGGVYQPYPSAQFPDNPKPPIHFLISPLHDAAEMVDFLKMQF